MNYSHPMEKHKLSSNTDEQNDEQRDIEARSKRTRNSSVTKDYHGTGALYATHGPLPDDNWKGRGFSDLEERKNELRVRRLVNGEKWDPEIIEDHYEDTDSP